MKHNSKLLLALLGIVLITSGCNGPEEDSEAGTDGISITEFSFNPSTIQAGQSGTIRMTVENLGAHQPDFAMARIDGPSIQSIDGEGSRWRVQRGVVRDIQSELLLDETDETAGGIAPVTWTTTFDSDIASDRVISKTWNGEVLYQYENPADTWLEVIDTKTYRQQQPERTISSATNNDGPVHLNIKTPQPIIHDPSDSGSTQTVVKVNVENLGSGVAYHPSTNKFEDVDNAETGASNPRNQICVRVDDYNVGPFRFSNTGERSGSCPGEVSQVVDIISGGGTASFNLEIDESATGEVEEQIRLTAEYAYLDTTSAPYTVEGAFN
jgi:hypothetical protein